MPTGLTCPAAEHRQPTFTCIHSPTNESQTDHLSPTTRASTKLNQTFSSSPSISSSKISNRATLHRADNERNSAIAATFVSDFATP